MSVPSLNRMRSRITEESEPWRAKTGVHVLFNRWG